MTRGDDVKQALARGVKALQSVDMQGSRTTITERAVVLDLLPNIADLSVLRSALAKDLTGQLSYFWIMKADLYEVFLVLSALWKYDQTLVDGECLAGAIQRLISCEVAVGGPYYSSSGGIQMSANLQIASFVRLIAKPLPRVDDFLNKVVASNIESTDPYQQYLVKLPLSATPCLAPLL